MISSGLVALVIALPATALTIRGTNGPDLIRGSARTDLLLGRGGNDRLLGLSGNDVLNGGPGRDYADGGPATTACCFGTTIATRRCAARAGTQSSLIGAMQRGQPARPC